MTEFDAAQILTTVREIKAREDDQSEETADRVLAAIRGAGVASVMPSATIPREGVLILVHPDVYARVRAATRSQEAS